jgi:ribosomal protein S19E (S16A)
LYLQLSAIGVVETMDKGGRRLTKEGQKDLDTIARSIAAEEA